jgi:antitoxin component of RelBE/YafQ-DinJ toxin-antitoxin module
MTGHTDFESRPARNAVLRVRVTKEAQDRFSDLCDELGVSVSDAVREALRDWTASHKPATKETS